jgi:hypothetical protein
MTAWYTIRAVPQRLVFSSPKMIALCLMCVLRVNVCQGAEAEPRTLATNFNVVERAHGRPDTKSDVLLKTGDTINAFATMLVSIDPLASLPTLSERARNVLVVVDLKKRKESTWTRVDIVNRYSWRVERSSVLLSPEHEEQEGVFYVRDDILDNGTLVREGDNVITLFLFDLTSGKGYYSDLVETQKRGRDLLTLDLQELTLVPSGSGPERYATKDGDEVRVRFLEAGYRVLREQDMKVFLDLTADDRRKLSELSKRARESQDIEALIVAEIPSSWKEDKKSLFRFVARHPDALANLRVGDVVTPGDELRFQIRRFGLKCDVSGVLLMGTRGGEGKGNRDELNPIKTTPSVGSNVYLTYDGRGKKRNWINWLPGAQLSLLGLNEPYGTKFTVGLVHPIYPPLRDYFGVFWAWHDLKTPVVGITFSPSIDFRALVSAEGDKSTDAGK